MRLSHSCICTLTTYTEDIYQQSPEQRENNNRLKIIIIIIDMILVTLNQERFQQNDIPTRLNYLAAHFNQIQSLIMPGVTISPGIVGSSFESIAIDSSEQIVSLIRESRYYIEWIVPHLIDIDIDQAAVLVDVGRVLTWWLFDWEKIWTDTDSRSRGCPNCRQFVRTYLGDARIIPNEL